MTKYRNRFAHLVFRALALASFALVAGCIDAAEPILTDGQPLLGERLSLQLFALQDGTARDPGTATFMFQDGRYVQTGGSENSLGDFTLHAFAGADFIAQTVKAGLPAEYAIVRKLVDGAYLVFVIEESDADEATRNKFCSGEFRMSCRVSTREAVLAFARATAAKPHQSGGLVLLMAEP